LQTGVWHWEAPHPEWKPGEDWDEVVSSYAIDGGEHLLIFDPLAVPGEIEDLAADRETAIVLTCPWHRRDAVGLAERLGAPLYVPPPDAPDPNPVQGHVFSAGDRLSVGVEAFPGMEANDLVLWVTSRRAIVTGDTLIVRDNGLEVPADWVGGKFPADWVGGKFDQIREGLRPLLDLPVEHVLATHGGPTDRAALERALS
jgi:glyoxylase-like metal-dependent hydrolase (beta-lactamase superfamily II)